MTGEMVREYNKALVKAVKTMQVNVEDTEELNLSHPEVFAALRVCVCDPLCRPSTTYP